MHPLLPGVTKGNQLVSQRVCRSCQLVIELDVSAQDIKGTVGHGGRKIAHPECSSHRLCVASLRDLYTPARNSSPMNACRSVTSMSFQPVSECLPCKFIIFRTYAAEFPVIKRSEQHFGNGRWR